MMRTLVAALASACLLAAPAPALAWGKTGHRVTGAIAERFLSPEAQAGVASILGTETLAEASTWPDEMRSDPSEFWQETANPWHYVTVPPERTYVEVGAPPEGDALSALERFAAVVRDPGASLEDKQLALRFIVHIVGDLHQPLHAGNGTDRGGNDHRVTFRGDSTNLHSVWDSGIIEGEQLSYTEWTAWLLADISPDEASAWAVPDPLVWVGESTQLRDRIYPEEERISGRYVNEHKGIVDQRLSQAGIRMAAYLNALFSEG